MKTTKIYLLLLLVLAFITPKVYGQENLPTKEKWNLETMQGTVTKIVKESREVTIMGAKGNLVTITASDQIERFDEIAVGDVITVEYGEYMMAEFREPTAEELAEPLVILKEGGKASKDMDPGAVVGAMVRAVVTIEAINRPYMMVVVQGPGGNFVTIDVVDGELIQKLHVGQVVILTYAEAVAVSLTKISAATAVE